MYNDYFRLLVGFSYILFLIVLFLSLQTANFYSISVFHKLVFPTCSTRFPLYINFIMVSHAMSIIYVASSSVSNIFNCIYFIFCHFPKIVNRGIPSTISQLSLQKPYPTNCFSLAICGVRMSQFRIY